jgi:4-hydroxybenzoate polyprenyltransferase
MSVLKGIGAILLAILVGCCLAVVGFIGWLLSIAWGFIVTGVVVIIGIVYAIKGNNSDKQDPP